jgi:pilus assembly protein CpaC
MASPMVVPIHKGQVITLPTETESIAVGNAEIAEIQKLDNRHLYVLGKKIGLTNVVLCNQKQCFKTLEVEISYDLDALKSKLHEIYPNENPMVYASRGSIVLSGQISSADIMNGILAIAGTFVFHEQATPLPPMTSSQGVGGVEKMLPGSSILQGTPVSNVINLMQVGGPQQVMLGVTVAEISRKLSRTLKVDFSAFGGGGDITGGAIGAGSVIQSLKQAAAATNPATLFFNFIGRDATVSTVINAAKDNGLAKILAEPTLTTISGQDAEFVSGGEFPVPIPQFGSVSGTGGGITVMFKEYGVILKFLPVVLNSGHINLKLNISVSEIDLTNKVVLDAGNTGQYVIPGLTKRNAASSMELSDGQTLGIAGLISDRVREAVSKFPGLGEIPILGQLFTSQTFLKDETELMIFVTPHLTKPIDPKNIRLPTDQYIEPTDTEFYLKGQIEGQSNEIKSITPKGGNHEGGGLRGHFGQGM